MAGFPKPRFFKPKNPQKYKGDPNNIVARSNLEVKFFNYCDLNRTVLEWSSEEFFIPYISVDGRTHRYFVDLWIKVKNKNNKVKEYVAEIKPYSQTKQPKSQKRITKQYKQRVKTYLINKCKWDYAEAFALKNNMNFVFLTEKDL